MQRFVGAAAFFVDTPVAAFMAAGEGLRPVVARASKHGSWRGARRLKRARQIKTRSEMYMNRPSPVPRINTGSWLKNGIYHQK